jgi:hypothetical protein
MQKLIPVLAFLAASMYASAQNTPSTASAKSDWTHVQVLPAGTRVHIKTLDHGSLHCKIASVDADSIVCGGVPLQRSSILYIKGRHKVRSTLVGVAVGYGAAAGVTTAYAESCKLNCKVGTFAGIGIFDLATVVATPILFGVYDLTAGTIYKAP